jgi:hypothetical protein
MKKNQCSWEICRTKDKISKIFTKIIKRNKLQKMYIEIITINKKRMIGTK